MTLVRRLVDTINTFEYEIRAKENSLEMRLDYADKLVSKIVEILNRKNTADSEKVKLLKYLLCSK